MILSVQIPTEVPHPDNNSPIDFTNPADIIIYVALPLFMVILYLVIRKRKYKSQK